MTTHSNRVLETRLHSQNHASYGTARSRSAKAVRNAESLRSAAMTSGHVLSSGMWIIDADASVSHGSLTMIEVPEHGDIQFFFRPSVQPAEGERYVLGVQSLFAILSPAGRSVHRRLRVGKKRMPATPRDRFWARIERVGSLQRVLGDLLEAERYSTKTRGERYQPAARPIARGTYAFVQHGDHVHLDYRVEPLPFEEAPEEIGLSEAASHLVLFENTEGTRATWTPRGSITQLDEEGAELVLVGSCREVADELGDASELDAL
jgi:hypothetical protein